MVSFRINLKKLNFFQENWFDLVCLENIFNMQVNCGLYIMSRSKLDSYEVDYGNDQIEIFTFESKLKLKKI